MPSSNDRLANHLAEPTRGSGWGWTIFLILFLPPLILQYFGIVFPIHGEVKMSQLREVAELMDEIYLTLAKMTYIPETAIKRGPHKIDHDLVREAGSSDAVFALLEILPYVDGSIIDEKSWLFGGEFIDYRNRDDLKELSDSLHHGGDYMSPNIVALTKWGQIQSVLLYDVENNNMRLIHSDLYFVHDLDFESLGDPKDRLRLRGPGAKEIFNKLPSCKGSKLLKDVLQRLKSTELLPWAWVSNFDEEEENEEKVIKQLLMKNGWPDTFNGDQFNADIIRYRSKPSSDGWGAGPLRYIKQIEGVEGQNLGWIQLTKSKINSLKKEVSATLNLQERLGLEWKLKKEVYNLARQENKLAEAKEEVQRLCPGGVCMANDELILWELRNIERNLEWVERAAREEWKRYEADLEPTDLSAEELERYRDIAEWKQQKLDWMLLARDQCESEVIKYCQETGAERLPPDNERTRAIENNKISTEAIPMIETYLGKLREWKSEIVDLAETELLEIMDGDIRREELEIERMKAIVRQTEEWYASQGEPL
jgi:hypothetical protein